jgi:hypothetical protein
MGQKRAKPSQELEADQIWRTMPFCLPRSSKICAGELKGWVADETNEHRDTLLMDARDVEPLMRLDMRIFVCFLMAGMVPLLSSFLHAILKEYGLLLSQLHPNSLLALSIFQYLCEAFVGVHPSLVLFHHY